VRYKRAQVFTSRSSSHSMYKDVLHWTETPMWAVVELEVEFICSVCIPGGYNLHNVAFEHAA
jgi:hypothetical protein